MTHWAGSGQDSCKAVRDCDSKTISEVTTKNIYTYLKRYFFFITFQKRINLNEYSQLIIFFNRYKHSYMYTHTHTYICRSFVWFLLSAEAHAKVWFYGFFYLHKCMNVCTLRYWAFFNKNTTHCTYVCT